MLAAEKRFTVIRVDIGRQHLALFLNDDKGRPFKRFDRLAAWLKSRGKTLVFAMNAGMYHRDFSPVGLFVADGQERSPLNQDDGRGNFFLKPNGVFLVSSSGPRVVETSKYSALSKDVRLATQSGPLLVTNGGIHPAFDPKSSSRLIRNGVGVSGNIVYFVISENPLTFHEFAVYFRDELHCEDALYLDGVVSGIYSADARRSDRRAALGPMLGIVE
jgi:uncharacterized protein YigE (DUF2233 family)